MSRLTPGLLLVALFACSAKAPPQSGDSPPRTTTPETALASPMPTALGGPGQAAPATPPRDPREVALAGIVDHLLEREHLLREPIDDKLSRAAFDSYLERLDAGKMFLLQGDRDQLAQYADKMDDELKSGDLTLAHEGSKIFVQRVAMVEQFVADLLAKPFDHSNQEFVELDPKKLGYATTEAELRERWRQRLELDILERVTAMEDRLAAAAKAKDPKAKDAKPDAADDNDDDSPVGQIPATAEARDAKARADLAKSYAGRFARLKHPGPLDAATEFVNAISESLDPHTTYLPPADKANFDIHMSGSLEGIGAVLRERDHYIEVIEIVPGGASWRGGKLAQGDLILAVQPNDGKDWVDVLDMRIDDVVKMIRGPKGTVVRLRLQKPTGNQETLAITRDVVIVEETYARAAVIHHRGGPAIGYIHLPSFYGGRGSARNAAVDIHRLLGELKAQKVKGVILDIRSNGGGLLSDAVEITGDLIDKGPVVQVQDSRGRREVLEDEQPGEAFDGPVIVMVDRFSASASEIVAAALQDYKRAIIVGTGPTHGKGTVQTLADLDRATGGKIELGVLKLTIQQFFRVNGSSTQREGVKPDILLPDPMAHVESGERTLDHAIAWSQIPAAQYVPWPKSHWNLPALIKASAARVAKQPVLSKLAATTQLLKQRRSETKVPLERKAWLARRTEIKAALDAASPKLDKLAPALVVKPLAEPKPTQVQAPNGKRDDRIAKWSDSLARDPWLDETVNILTDVIK